ncbi:hypothetical protein FA95DRAFT_1298169 [Auriscalpium vulgare]|uniref:Uncharacterized protein n=1 Tax=Auriscalpium vulgare TaxID=40419 RepID=A0ACB8R1S9_9AGAM|nr:hypothetical protein FA95DRAFT_1298169 [Auriscalpium vulgare]
MPPSAHVRSSAARGQPLRSAPRPGKSTPSWLPATPPPGSWTPSAVPLASPSASASSMSPCPHCIPSGLKRTWRSWSCVLAWKVSPSSSIAPAMPLIPPSEARLRAAQLHPVCLEVEAEYTMVEWIVRLWPSVRALSVYVSDGRIELPQPLPEIYIPDTVQSMSIEGNDQIRIFSWRANSPPLRELELKWPEWWHDSSVCQQLHVSGVLPHLQTLRIDGDFPPQEVLMHPTRLETLLFTELPVDDAVISLPPALIRLSSLSGSRIIPNLVIPRHSRPTPYISWTPGPCLKAHKNASLR